MDAPSSLHPTDRTLSSYGLGKLDDRSADAVNKHLHACPDCRRRAGELSADSFLERVRDARQGPAASGPSASIFDGTRSHAGASRPAPPAAETLPPGLADHPDYEIKKELGRGGMGVVYLAHNRLMGRDEVLKVMGRHLMERPGVLDRFLREIRAVAKLRHPNIVTAYSAVRVGESIVFGMEHVEGLDLSKLVKAKGPLPVAHACNFIHQASLGLQHAHEEGLVHRDIKPANLMLSRKGDRATVKVLDFGLAKAAREEKVDGGLTTEGQALGTPDYIAPEQIIDATSADIRADIYSLGGTLFYLLTGRPPFQATSLYDLYQAHVSRDADPLNLVRPEVPAELAALVAKMMAKGPSRRFQEPGEVARALEPYFKRANAKYKAPGSEATRPPRADAGRPAIKAVLTPNQPPPGPPKVAARPESANRAADPEPRWEGLIEFHDPESPSVARPEADAGRRPPWRRWPTVLAGSILGLVALGAVVIVVGARKAQVDPTASGGGAVASAAASPSAGGGPAGPSQAVPVEPGFTSLFNGVDLEGWTASPNDPANWRVEDGAIVGGAGSDDFLFFEEVYSRFVLRLQFQLDPGTDGAVALWGLPGDVPLRALLERAGATRFAAAWESSRRLIYAKSINDKYALRPDGSWNDLEVDVSGEEARVTLNGELILDENIQKLMNGQGNEAGGLARRSGRIGLQRPWGKGSVRYRAIRVRPLPDAAEVGSVSPAAPELIQGPSGVKVEPVQRPLEANDAATSDFLPLFNGRDLSGWTVDSGPPNSWRVEGGDLVVTGPGDWKRSGFLLSDRAVSDFLLRFEFLPSPGSNSGVTFWAMPSEFAGRLAHPLQVELIRGVDRGIKNGSFMWSTSTLNSEMLPPDRPVGLLPNGSWNKAEVEVRGDTLQVTINGNRILTTDLRRLAGRPGANPALKRRSGHVGFQSHTGKVRFRSIEIKGPTPTRPVAWPADAKEFRGKHYKVFPQQLTWHQAVQKCKELKGHLAIVSGDEENRALTSEMSAQGVEAAWIGATDERAEGEWAWVDGSRLGFSNWDLAARQPNNKQGLEHYALILLPHDGKWSDQPNHSIQHHPGFICQWD